jgi:uncharacterized lipoprotein YmbA
MTYRPIAVCLLAVLAGCNSPPVRYYTLMPEARLGVLPASLQSTETVIVIGPVTIPAMLDQTQMVVGKGSQQMDVREVERWVAPLKEEFTSALAARLGILLPQATVAAFQQSAGMDADIRILVDVSRFELGPGQQTTLDVLWRIKGDGISTPRRGRTQISMPAKGPGYEHLAEAQGRAMEQLAGELAANLKANEK